MRCVLALSLLLATISTASFAASGSPAEQRACRGDARRFCKDAYGNELLVLACLQEHRGRLTASCRKVLRDHGQ